jgi:hypothetical protein
VKRRRPHAFRLEDKSVEVIDRWAADLTRKSGRPVTRSEAVRFILEGFRRAEAKLPEIDDIALLNDKNVRS